VRLIPVSEPADERLADFRDLTDADVRPDRRGLVVAEGTAVVDRLLSSPYRVRAILGLRDRVEGLARTWPDRDVPAFVVDKWLLSDIVGFRVTRGVLASASRPPARDCAELLAASRRLVILESLNDFENLGALFRNAAAFGVDAVLLDPRCADPLYRRSVRVSMGHVLRVPFGTLPGRWPDSLAAVQGAGYTVLAMTPRAAAVPIRRMVVPRRWALLLGAEGPGLSPAALAAADVAVRIPMADGVDSLNVATAAAVALAELTGDER
jgi:tRNA G18 (ribose-2'-O)-methylase SpoU